MQVYYKPKYIRTRKFELADIDDIEVFNNKNYTCNYIMRVNTPVFISGEKITTSVNRLLLNIDVKDRLKNLGINDYNSWDNIILREIEELKKFFLKFFGKLPTVIYNSGQGINVLIELDNSYDKETIKGEFINELILIHDVFKNYYQNNKYLQFNSFLDKINHNDSDVIYRYLTREHCRVPIEGMKVFNKFKTSLIYTHKIFFVEFNDTMFNISKIALNLGVIHFNSKNVYDKNLVDTIAKNVTDKCVFCGLKHNHKLYDNGFYTCFTCGESLNTEELYFKLFNKKLDIGKYYYLSDLKDLCKNAVYDNENNIIFNFETDYSKFQISTEDVMRKSIYNKLRINHIKTEKSYHPRDLISDLQDMIDDGDLLLCESTKAGVYPDKIIFNEYDTDDIFYKPFIPLTNTPSDINNIKTELNRLDNDYLLLVLSTVFAVLNGVDFENATGIHSLFIVYGMRDSGKTSFINMVQSFFSDDYQLLSYSFKDPFDFLRELQQYNYIPLLIDEYNKYKTDDGFFQVLKEISSNGGKLVMKTNKRMKKKQKMDIKGTPFLCSEVRRATLDPSLYQRAIELNLDLLISNIDITNIFTFRNVLNYPKTTITKELLEFKNDNKILFENELKRLINSDFSYLFNSINGKKQLLVVLYIVSIKQASMWLNKNMDKSINPNNLIDKYLRGEILHNGITERKEDISKIVLSFIATQFKSKFSIMAENLHISVRQNFIVRFNISVLLKAGFSNAKLLNELKTYYTEPRVNFNNEMFQADGRILASYEEGIKFIQYINSLTKVPISKLTTIENKLKRAIERGGYK